ncbi:MAG: iron-sulfur cluster assembly accessory protein [Corynebacterium sp.]|uniref:HesB/IscA family protein n=1 Tax=Corynebacterium sp. TaxID=1720 RepID=UPI0026DAD727|nr:iron-sulfur cluster assembly accessory protein [Corynebacterium sp.]MDO5097879.1 iron-sulfur cluster assembly accessory protein [Corynebacterium sp.]
MTTPTTNTGVIVTPEAVAKAKALIAQEADGDKYFLRLAVAAGGCAGLQYRLEFQTELLDGDKIDDYDGLRFVVDKKSVPFLIGATVKFEDTLQSSGFAIENPNATGSCACGDSFN